MAGVASVSGPNIVSCDGKPWAVIYTRAAIRRKMNRGLARQEAPPRRVKAMLVLALALMLAACGPAACGPAGRASGDAAAPAPSAAGASSGPAGAASSAAAGSPTAPAALSTSGDAGQAAT